MCCICIYCIPVYIVLFVYTVYMSIYTVYMHGFYHCTSGKLAARFLINDLVTVLANSGIVIGKNIS